VNILCAEDICGLEGKTTRSRPEYLISNTEGLPEDLLQKHRNLTLAVYIIYINQIPFVMTVSKGTHVVMEELIKTRKQQQAQHHSKA